MPRKSVSIAGELLHELPWRLYGRPLDLDWRVPTTAMAVLLAANPWLSDLDDSGGYALPGGREIIVPALSTQADRQPTNVGWS